MDLYLVTNIFIESVRLEDLAHRMAKSWACLNG